VGVFKYLFVKDIVEYATTESVALKGSGACRVIGDSGGYAIHSTRPGPCRIEVAITNKKTGKVVFRGMKDVQSKRTTRSKALPRKNPIPVKIAGLRKCERIQVSGARLTDWRCRTSSNTSQIFNASMYDWFVGLKQHRDFVPGVVGNTTMDELCRTIVATVKSVGATLIEAAKCNASTRRSFEQPILCASKGDLTVIWEITPVYESKLLTVTTMWQTGQARTRDFEDLVDYATAEPPVAGADYSGLWNACDELVGRMPRRPNW
jgi:hypothetical protein